MDSCDFISLVGCCIFERKLGYAFRCLFGDELNALHDSGYDEMLDARIFAFSIFSYCDQVHAIVWGLEALDRFAWSHICIQIELSTDKKQEFPGVYFPFESRLP
jgi:hypothetical protein